MEIWPDRSRGLLAGLIGAASNVGFLMIAVVGLGLSRLIDSAQRLLLDIGLAPGLVEKLVSHSGWRLMMFIGALPALLTFFIRLFVPESERWEQEKREGTTSHWATRDLIAVAIGTCGPLAMIYLWSPGQTFSLSLKIGGSVVGVLVAILGYIFPVLRYLQRAAAVAGDRAAGNSQSALGTRNVLRRMLLGACLSGVALVGTWASVQLAPSWAGKLVEASAKRDGLDPDSKEVRIAKGSARSLTQILSGLGAIVGTIAGALMAKSVGRRVTYTALCAGSLVASLVFYLTNTAFGPLFLIEILFVGGLTAAFYGWLPLYLPELFPTRVRATGQGFSYNFGRIIAAVGALQTGALMGLFGQDNVASHASACSMMSLVYLVGIVIIWLAPETRGRPLPE
jgi:MFS family permease